ncbi:MAG: hypothetical protein OXH63_06365 [Gemmatimonadetes bacterium]|nr:hypothetical protein [Gemmatimonadota bacterium]
MKRIRMAVAAGLLVWLPLSAQAQAGVQQDLGARIAEFQQRLDAAYAEAQREAEREEVLAARREAELRRRGITVQGGSATTPAQRLQANVEEKMRPEKIALRTYVEDFLGMCLREIDIGINPLPHFSIKLISKRPNETCS